MDYLYKLARRGMKGYDCTFIRKFSMDAVQDFPDESLDFVYIDGCHQFRYIAEDVPEWSQKVRKGGIVSGHDYARFHPGGWAACQVAEVVDAYVKAFQIKRWYLLGNVEAREGEKRDKYRSWMWVKE
jgi:SAM-dependent methyltransferase